MFFGIKIKENDESGGWHNGSAFIIYADDSLFDPESTPTSAETCM